MNQDNVKGDFMEEAIQQNIDKFAHMDFDQLLSAYAIAYKANDVATFTDYRGEIMDRVRTLRVAQSKFKSVLL